MWAWIMARTPCCEDLRVQVVIIGTEVADWAVDLVIGCLEADSVIDSVVGFVKNYLVQLLELWHRILPVVDLIPEAWSGPYPLERAFQSFSPVFQCWQAATSGLVVELQHKVFFLPVVQESHVKSVGGKQVTQPCVDNPFDSYTPVVWVALSALFQASPQPVCRTEIVQSCKLISKQ